MTSSPSPASGSPAGGPDFEQEGASAGTKERLLDASEALFAERGFAGTSVREVTRAAGVAVSAANYHFGSKEALLRAALMRRIQPANARRLALLDQAVASGAALEDVLAAFFRPALELRAQAFSRGDASHTLRLSALLYANPPAFVEELKRELFGEVLERFEAALGRALPDADRDQVAVFAQLAIGTMVHLMRGEVGFADSVEPEVERQIALLVQFAAGGIRQVASQGTLGAEGPVAGTPASASPGRAS